MRCGSKSRVRVPMPSASGRESLAASLGGGADSNRSRRMSGRLSTTSQPRRSEEHTSELQSLMRISYAVFCLKKKTTTRTQRTDSQRESVSKTQQTNGSKLVDQQNTPPTTR